jgi:hypothetical protein
MEDRRREVLPVGVAQRGVDSWVEPGHSGNPASRLHCGTPIGMRVWDALGDRASSLSGISSKCAHPFGPQWNAE